MIPLRPQGSYPNPELRAAIALAAISRDPFRFPVEPTPADQPTLTGTTRTYLEAFADIFSAKFEHFGADITSVVVSPDLSDVSDESFQFTVDPPGSTVELLALLLPGLLLRDYPTRLELLGATHMPDALLPEQLESTIVPLVEQLGGELAIELDAYGFPPRGEGRLTAEIEPVAGRIAEPNWSSRGRIRELEATVVLAHLQRHIGEREVETLAGRKPRHLPLGATLVESFNAPSQGNALIVEVRCEELVETLAVLGERGVQAETIGERCGDALETYVGGKGAFQATDWLATLLAAAGGGELTATEPGDMTMAVVDLVPSFLGTEVGLKDIDDRSQRIWMYS